MTLWKKALSTALTATMLASLLATAAASSVLAATVTVSSGTVDYIASSDSVPADGASTIVLTFSPAVTTGVSNITITTTAGKFTSTSSGSGIVIGATQTIATVTNPTNLAISSTLTLTAPTTAGSGLVTVQLTPVSGGDATTDSITTFTFTAAASTAVSTAYSTTALSATSVPAVGGSTGVTATTTVRDTNNVPIAAGVAVTWTLTGPAYFAGTLTTTSLATVANSSGIAGSPLIFSTGVAGAVTVATSVKYLNVTYALATKTLNLVGPVFKIALVNNIDSIPNNNSNASTAGIELEAVVTDTSGQPIGAGVTFAVGAYTPANIFIVDPLTAVWDPTDKAWDMNVDCVGTSVTGTATVTIKASTTLSGTTTTVTSDPITFTCADKLAADALGTLDISASATTVAPNGSVNILVSVKDVNGLPAPDGTAVTAVTNGVGTVVSSSGVLNSSTTSNGTAKFIFLAPANAGSATVTAFVANAVPSSKSVTIAIGAVSVTGTNGSKLGLGSSGVFSTATKIQALNGYVTWKLSFGAASAGQSAGIWIATKNSAGVWSSFTKLTGRTIDSAGNAYFHYRASSAKWISIRGSAGSTFTPATQARWR